MSVYVGSEKEFSLTPCVVSFADFVYFYRCTKVSFKHIRRGLCSHTRNSGKQIVVASQSSIKPVVKTKHPIKRWRRRQEKNLTPSGSYGDGVTKRSEDVIIVDKKKPLEDSTG
nr:3-oxoacyl-[acyl-carrier-protein] synthase 2 [Tanacetum cinerariifolium]